MRVLAELVVIVVGVLIALWVDNLNTERQDRRQEQAYLAGIVEDLRGDSSALVDRRTAAVRSLEVADRLIELRFDPPSPVPADSLAEWFFRAAFVDNFQVLDHTYREVLGAGGLTLISDDAVRRGISSYYRDIDSAEFFTEYYKGEESDYWDLLAERLDAADFAALTRSDRRGSLDVRRMLTLLREDDEIVNAVQMNRHWAELRLEITNRRIASNSSLIEVLRARLLDLG
jgi:hypothetical protein